jgi:hypothetical protein
VFNFREGGVRGDLHTIQPLPFYVRLGKLGSECFSSPDLQMMCRDKKMRINRYRFGGLRALIYFYITNSSSCLTAAYIKRHFDIWIGHTS